MASQRIASTCQGPPATPKGLFGSLHPPEPGWWDAGCRRFGCLLLRSSQALRMQKAPHSQAMRKRAAVFAGPGLLGAPA